MCKEQEQTRNFGAATPNAQTDTYAQAEMGLGGTPQLVKKLQDRAYRLEYELSEIRDAIRSIKTSPDLLKLLRAVEIAEKS